MSSTAFFTGIVVVIGLVLAIFITPILFIPVGLLLIFALFSAPLLAWWAKSSSGGSRGEGAAPQPGTPSTREAAYDPVERPSGLAPRGGD